MNSKSTLFVLCLSSTLVFAACGDPQATNTEPNANDISTADSGELALTADIQADKDISGVAYRIERVSCDGEAFEPLLEEAKVDLEDMRIPGMIPEFEDAPLDEQSAHLFADEFFVLPEGCYDVTAQPIQADGSLSEECAAAEKRDVEVFDGETTEIVLISQCEGDPRGALDVVAGINNPPTLLDLEYSPSKFVYECEQTTICATAEDPDGDPLEFVWTQTEGEDLHSDFSAYRVDSPYGTVTECVDFAPQWTDNYGFNVKIYDLTGTDQRMEDWLAEEGYAAESHDDLNFPLYVNWDIELQCINNEGELFDQPGMRDVQRAPGCDWITPAEFYCSDKAPNPDETCPNGVFDPYTVYPACAEPTESHMDDDHDNDHDND